MPSGYRNPIPCDGCAARLECARSAWTCAAFNRYVANLPWSPDQRGPSVEATRAALVERERATVEERDDEKRRRQLANQRDWRRRNREHVRAQRRLHARKVYQRIKQDPVRYAAMRERQLRWEQANIEKVIAYKERYQQANAERVRASKRRYALRKRAQQRTAGESPAAAPLTTPAGSARLDGGALSQ